MGATVYCMCNQKGGCAKSVSSVNLGIGLAHEGKRVLLCDVDSQGSLTASLGWQQPDQMEVTLSTILGGILTDKSLPPGSGILHHAEGIDVLPANIELCGLENTLVNAMGRETVLRQYLDTMREDYDVIILDCMPSLNILTINALAAADQVIIPCQSQFLSMKGLEQLIRTIARVKRNINPKLSIAGILITMADMRTNYARDIVELLHTNYDGKLRIFDSIIPMSVRVAESSAAGKSIYLHDPAGKAAAAYAALTKEVLEG